MFSLTNIRRIFLKNIPHQILVISRIFLLFSCPESSFSMIIYYREYHILLISHFRFRAPPFTRSIDFSCQLFLFSREYLSSLDLCPCKVFAYLEPNYFPKHEYYLFIIFSPPWYFLQSLFSFGKFNYTNTLYRKYGI